jgi:predicted thioredoxin/glutaredoxin
MMAVETFVYLYIAAFAFSTFIAAALLIAAARHISSQERRTPSPARGTRRRERELLKSWSEKE